jgi:RND family efflux transporter MFP subunit
MLRSTSAGLFLWGAVLAASACGGHKEPGGAASQVPADVLLQEARVEVLSQPFEAGGVVRARTTAVLTSRIVAEVQDVLARPGDRVRAGQALVRLDSRELAANLARAEASLASANEAVKAATAGRDAAVAALSFASASHKRIADLRARNSATPSELDEAVSGLRAAESRASGADAAIRQAEANVNAARDSLRATGVAASYAVIAAPFDGVVSEKFVEPGNMAAPGAPLMTVEDTRGFRLEVRVDESRAALITDASPVAVLLDSTAGGSGPPSLTGRVAEVARTMDPLSHAYLVKIDLPDAAPVRSGMFGRARFAGPARRTLTVAASAVVRRGQLASVFVAGGDNRARLRLVTTGIALDDRVEITAGLDAGETVVLAPPPTLVDGAPVRGRLVPAAVPPRAPGGHGPEALR